MQRYPSNLMPTKEPPEREAVLKVESWLEQNGPSWMSLWTTVARLTGARVGEIAALRPADLDVEDLDMASIRVRRRAGPPRVVPICRALAERLAQWMTGQGLSPLSPLFGVSHQTACRHPVRILRRACEAVGVSQYAPHSLRRLRALDLHRADVPTPVIAELLGLTLSGYAQDVTFQDLQDAVRRVDGDWANEGADGESPSPQGTPMDRSQQKSDCHAEAHVMGLCVTVTFLLRAVLGCALRAR